MWGPVGARVAGGGDNAQASTTLPLLYSGQV